MHKVIIPIALILVFLSMSIVHPAEPDNLPYLYVPIIVEASRKHDVDHTIIQAIIMAESTYNPKAKSNRGAEGLMQLMPETAKALGVKNAFDPTQNIHGGVKYFRQLLDRFDGKMDYALAAYNAGEAKVLRYNGVPPYPVTRRYIKKVYQYQQFYKAKGGEF